MDERNLRKTRVGTVVSNKMDKTVVVAIKDNVKHPLYKKIMKRTVKFKAHDEENACGIGDKVQVMETRPLSKDKHWRVVRITRKSKIIKIILQSFLNRYLISVQPKGGTHCDTDADLSESCRQYRSERTHVHPCSGWF